jgi:beta-lactamase regulating signal transducer with metallopeptidase domain
MLSKARKKGKEMVASDDETKNGDKSPIYKSLAIVVQRRLLMVVVVLVVVVLVAVMVVVRARNELSRVRLAHSMNSKGRLDSALLGLRVAP